MKKEETSLTRKTADENALSPVFVEAEKLFERLAEITKETTRLAYEFFQKRGAEIGTHLDDWLKAEAAILRPAPVEITETDKNINVRAVVAGFNPEEIEISVKDDLLILSGETEAENKKEDENTVYSEWRSNRFFRRMTLPCEVDPEKAKTKLKDGVLYLTLPKAAAREETKISVKAA